MGLCISPSPPSLSTLSEEVSSENFLDYKSRGVNGSHKGQIVWKIEANSYFVERKCISGNTSKTSYITVHYIPHTLREMFYNGCSICHSEQDTASSVHIVNLYIQWGKKVFSQPPIVQVLPLKKMRGL
jgi:hypothetical protein